MYQCKIAPTVWKKACRTKPERGAFEVRNEAFQDSRRKGPLIANSELFSPTYGSCRLTANSWPRVVGKNCDALFATDEA